MQRTLKLVAFAVTTFVSTVAHAEDPSCKADGNVVVLHGDGVPPALLGPFVQQLRASLTRRSLGLCVLDSGDAEPPVTRPLAGLGLTVESNGADLLIVTVNVRDEITAKRVARDVDLRGLPEDARALVLAEATDELLRASWAELMVPDAPPPKQEPPPAVRRAVEPVRIARGPLVDVAAGIAGETYGTGQRQFGVNVDVMLFPVERVGALLQVGLRAVPHSEAHDGVVDASALVGAAGVALAPLRPSHRYGLWVGPELFATQATFRGVSSTALGTKDTATAEHIAAFARGWIAIAGPLRASAALLVGAPIHPVRVVAEHESVTGVGGILAGAEIALGAAW